MPENVYFIVAAYAATWIVILGYLLRLRALDTRASKALDHATSARGRHDGLLLKQRHLRRV